MDPVTRLLMQGAAGAGANLYVEDVFSTYLYTGNGSTQTITNGIDLAGKGGLVWIKSRSHGQNHQLFDTVRGATKELISNSDVAQTTDADTLTAFNATGFDLGADATTNTNTYTYASWTFRKAPKFFDVVTYVGDGTNNRAIPHDLGSIPGCIIVKQLDGGIFWAVKHRSLTASQYLVLSDTAAATTTFDPWTTNPTATEFYVNGVASSLSNGTGSTYVAYLFAHDAGGFGDSGNESVIKCGTATDNTIVDLGWEPQWILIKPVNSAGAWHLVDNMRGLGVEANTGTMLFPNSSTAETPTSYFRITSTGFHSGNVGWGNTIYIAIRRGPMKVPTDATKVYNGVNDNSGLINVGFVPDLALINTKAQWDRNPAMARLTGTDSLRTNAANAKETQTIYWDATTGYFQQAATGGTPMTWLFRRAPGFFDVVAYTGTGASQALNHNLNVAPELIIVKARSATSQWRVGTSFASTTYATGDLNNDTSWTTGVSYGSNWFSAQPTSTTFGVTSSIGASSTTYIAYLFATLSGVSKVGSYTGTGTTLSIDCGFTAGARFVLIKRTNSTGDWYVWDTARGIISGDDPYLLLNSTAAEVTNTDYIDPLSSGFEISSTAPAAINASGGSFIFLAIA